MRPITRKHLLMKEGASRPDSYEAPPGEFRALKRERSRKYRKLKRQAEKRGVSLDAYLAIREGERRLEILRDAVGQHIVWRPGSFSRSVPGISYVCEIVENFKTSEKEKFWARVDGTYRMRTKKRTRRMIKLRVLGYARIQWDAGRPPQENRWQRIFPVGHEFDVQARGVNPSSLGTTAKIKTLGECAQVWVEHAERCLASDRERLATDDGKDPFWTSVWTRGVESWAVHRDTWKAWIESLPERC